MSSSKIFKNESDINKVLKMIEIETANVSILQRENSIKLNSAISSTEELLISLGYDKKVNEARNEATNVLKPKPLITSLSSWDEITSKAQKFIKDDIDITDFFTKEELKANQDYIIQLNKEFNEIHKLDTVDITIPALAGIVGGVIDCILGGFIKTSYKKNIPGTLSNYVEKLFNKALPLNKVAELENLAKVTYDAQDNRNTTIFIDTLSSHFHRFLQLGHDPILGFIFGVIDMLKGTMTTIDYKGNFIIQAMEVYSDRKAINIFEAISKVFLHMLSDVNTPAGLPAPFMALCNKLQFGSIGADNQNIAEIVKSMYGQGYDFRHFCAMSIPTMITEVIVRISYFFKRKSEGFPFRECVPIGLDHVKKPKLATMLWIAHSSSVLINAGKVVFTKSPMNINYPQWLAFSRYSIKQLKWVLLDKPEMRERYVMNVINNDWKNLYEEIDCIWNTTIDEGIITYEL